MEAQVGRASRGLRCRNGRAGSGSSGRATAATRTTSPAHYAPSRQKSRRTVNHRPQTPPRPVLVHPVPRSSRCELSAHPNLKLEVRWIPGHSGFAGNERADRLANEAGMQTPVTLCNRTITWPKAQPTHRASQTWRSVWAASHRSHYVTSHLPKPPSLRLAKFHSEFHGPRDVHCRLIQVILGHGFFGEYYDRFVPNEDPNCPCGSVTVQSLRHVLLDWLTTRLGCPCTRRPSLSV